MSTETTITEDEMRARCLRNESDAYRKAIVRLVCDSSNGGRKTIDKADVFEIASRALEEGNAWHRRSKGESWDTIGRLR